MPLPLKYNVRNLFVRKTSTLMTISGIAMVVSVFIIVMALAEGIKRIGAESGNPLHALVLTKGANAETQSGIDDTTADAIENAPGVPRDERGPISSRDLFVVLNLPRAEMTATSNVVARGVTDRAFELRPFVKIDGGKRPRGSEIVIGRPLAARFANMNVGNRVHFGRRDWTVAALFDAPGTAFESEIWVDAKELAADFRRETGGSSVTIRMNRPEDIEALKRHVDGDKALRALKVWSETEYYAEQKKTATPIEIVGKFITVLLSIGAGLGAMNTMYAAIGNRAREIGTLRALGFGRSSILFAFVLESTLIGFLGGLAGCVLSLPIHGISTGTGNWQTFSEIAFQFRITPPLLLRGILIGAAVGAIGGFIPAWVASRKPIVGALRGA